MNNSRSPDEPRMHRRFFIVLEVVLALAWCGLLIESNLASRHIWYSGTFSNICFWALGISIILLLFVLPWFWATLRHVALVGWLMAAASILFLALYSPAHR
ncbi:MAG: hypothetical protein ABI651_02690 [Verrucomicrobiota bacterium]